METPKEILEILKQPLVKEIKKHRSSGRISVRDNRGYKVARSRFVWEQINGKIPKGMIIHHKNGIKNDDRIENLEMLTIKEHGMKHREMRKLSREQNN